MNRAWLYHEDTPSGKIFTNDREYMKAIEDGWVKAPADVGKKPVKKSKVKKPQLPPFEEH